MTYHRGTLAEFEAWHENVMIAENIPAEGKVGLVNGVPAPKNQRTVAYSKAIPHPVNANDYIWNYGKYLDENKIKLNQDDAENEGWFVK